MISVEQDKVINTNIKLSLNLVLCVSVYCIPTLKFTKL